MKVKNPQKVAKASSKWGKKNPKNLAQITDC